MCVCGREILTRVLMKLFAFLDPISTVVILTGDTYPDDPICSFTGWLGYCLFFCLVSNWNCQIHPSAGSTSKGQGHPGATPEAAKPALQIWIIQGQAVFAGARRGEGGIRCHYCSLLTSDSNPASATTTVGSLMCIHCGSTLSLSAPGLLFHHHNSPHASPNN